MKVIGKTPSRKTLSVLLVIALVCAGAPARVAADDAAATSDGSTAAAPSAQGEEGAGGAPTGLYRGVVTDRRAGKPVPGAVVVFMNEDTGDTFETVTDEKGMYETRLPAGEYLVDIRVGKTIYRSAGTFREEAPGKRWVMDFTVGSKLTEKDLKIETTPTDIRVVSTEPRPPLEGSKKWMEFWIFLGGLVTVGALAD